MRYHAVLPVLPILLALPLLLLPISTVPASAQESGGGEQPAADYDWMLEAVSLYQQDKSDEPEPWLFRPIYFRPPVPFLKLDDRFEAFVADEDIQVELARLERMLRNPLADLGRELSTGIRYERDANGRLVRTMKVGDRFEFSATTNQNLFGTNPYGLPGTWNEGYDIDEWLQGAQEGRGPNDD